MGDVIPLRPTLWVVTDSDDVTAFYSGDVSPVTPTLPEMGAKGSKKRISTFVEPFIAAKSYKPTAAKQRRSVLGQFIEHTNNPRAKDLDHQHVLRWWTAIMSLAVSSRQSHLSGVKGFCAHLHHTGATPSNPADVIQRPKGQQTAPVTLTPSEVRTLLLSLPSLRERAMISLGLGCALRAMEIAQLRVEDIDFTNRILTVRGGKGGKDRRVPIPQITIECLTDYLMEHRPSKTAAGHAYGPVIRRQFSQEALTPGYVRQRIAQLLEQAGIKRGPHDGRSSHVLRRTCATTLLESGASIRDVQTILGHENLSSTERYLRRPDEDRLVTLIDRGPMAG